MHSLDIIDECISIHHSVRKNAIKMKSSPVKHVGKYPVLHNPLPLVLDEEAVASGSMKRSIIKPGTPQSRGRNELCYDSLSPELAKKLKGRQEIKNDDDNEGYVGSFSIKPMGTLEKDFSKVFQRQMSLSSNVSFSSTCSQESIWNENDIALEAKRVLKAVRNEFKHWWENNRLKRDDRDERGFFTDDLTETYLTYRLDKLPITDTVLSIRRTIVNLIENFESNAMLPYDLTGDKRHREGFKPVTNYAIEKARKEEEERIKEEEAKKKVEEDTKLAYLEKKKKEKELIRKQYDDYMKSLEN